MWTRVFTSAQRGLMAATRSAGRHLGSRVRVATPEVLKELALEDQFEALDQFLRIQNLRRLEEDRLHRLMREVSR